MSSHKFDSSDDYFNSLNPRANQIEEWLGKRDNMTKILLGRPYDVYEALSSQARMKLTALMIFFYYDMPKNDNLVQDWVHDVSNEIATQEDDGDGLLMADPEPIIKICLICDRKTLDMPDHIFAMVSKVSELIYKEMLDQEFVHVEAASVMDV